jgi:flavin reductase (DIM6/NTAB) family NADH-FMN oxidoreductase RutF
MSDYFYEPARGHGLPHDPFKAIVGPRPIGWISTTDKSGCFRVAPYSFFNAICDKPPMIAFSSSGRKNTMTNAQEKGEFVYNLATRTLAENMNISSTSVAHDIDKFELAGLTPAQCNVISIPRVAESPASLECKLVQIIELKDVYGKSAQHWLVIGQVVGVHINQNYLKDGIFDTAAANPILRAGYLDQYAEIKPDVMFKMKRPAIP